MIHMKTSPQGILEICEVEGIVPAPYMDSRNNWTYGVGHTAAAGGPDPEDLPRGMPSNMNAAIIEAVNLFKNDVEKYENRVCRAIKVKLEQHQFDALVSWDFNTGGATWRSRSGRPCQLVQQINRGDMSGEGFMGWLQPPEIRGRRKAEQDLFRTGDYAANGDVIPIWNVDHNGRLRGRHSIMSGAELLKIINRHERQDSEAGGWVGLVMGFLAALFAKRK